MRKYHLCPMGIPTALSCAAMFFFCGCSPLQSYSYQDNPDCKGLYDAISEALHPNVALETILCNDDEHTMHVYLGLKSYDSYVSDAYAIAQAANTYLAETEDAPEHQYDIALSFSDINDAAPIYISFANFEQLENGETLHYDGLGYGKFCSHLIEGQQLADYTWLQTVELFDCKEIGDIGIFDRFSHLSRLLLNNNAISEEQLRRFGEQHPDCAIIANRKDAAHWPHHYHK